MRVRLERSGGFANLGRAVEVETAALPTGRAEELRRLLEAAGLAGLVEQATPPAGSPDRFVYRLTVEDDAGRRAVTVGESAASAEMRRLIDWLETTAAG